MNVSRRNFLKALFLGAPAVVLAAPDVVRLLAAEETPGPSRQVTWAGDGDFPAGRHLIAEVVADDGRHAVLMKVGMAYRGEGVALFYLEFAEPPVAVAINAVPGAPEGVLTPAAVNDVDGMILAPPGKRLQLWAELPAPGSAAGYLFCERVML